ncbi:concanavalin A-like lectin/glucanase domain-containing protein [Auriculariales sp. MPI-PUGE-AT-0066]|nr:concanavalin A-like lectin/glucanase domain-containing protein [Auriculariales sp. MPI-PUGE-AT-0066]
MTSASMTTLPAPTVLGTLAWAWILATATDLATAKTYTLHTTSAGDSFFDTWNFPGGWNSTTNTPTYDVTNSGDNWLANQTFAQQDGIVSINDAKHVILRVDNKNEVLYNDKRYSFRIESNEIYGAGSLFVFDALHIPYGCSVWPAYWTTGENWPEGGEIDILENVNQAKTNQMALHTHGGQGCKVEQSDQITGTVAIQDCGDSLNGNTGCIIVDSNANSFSGFNSNQGGMWVTEFALEAISIWFFSRANIPDALKTDAASQTVDTATFGTPTAKYPSTSCDIANLFKKQKIIINTTLCGVFAGAVFNDTCTAKRENSCYLDWVIGPANAYDEAYFEIVSHRVFTDGSDTSAPDPNPTASPTTSGGGNGVTTMGPNGLPTVITLGGGSSASRVTVSLLLVLAAFVFTLIV